MYIFIDTEFTRLTRDAELISLGAVSEDGRRFYCELAPVDQARCSEFVRNVVLPLLEGGAVACSRAEFAARLADWLRGFDNPVLLSDSEWDIYVLRHALTGQLDWRPGSVHIDSRVEATLLTLAPMDDQAYAVFEGTVNKYYEIDPRQHHALVDALAIRAGLLAVRAATEGA